LVRFHCNRCFSLSRPFPGHANRHDCSPGGFPFSAWYISPAHTLFLLLLLPFPTNIRHSNLRIRTKSSKYHIRITQANQRKSDYQDRFSKPFLYLSGQHARLSLKSRRRDAHHGPSQPYSSPVFGRHLSHLDEPKRFSRQFDSGQVYGQEGRPTKAARRPG